MAKQSVHGAGVLLLKSRFYGSSPQTGSGWLARGSSTWLTALRPSCVWSSLGWGAKCTPRQCATTGFWSEVGLQAGREQRSVNGNARAQVAGHQFYTAGHGELMAAGALGGQIKAARSRSTDDGGHSAADYGT